MKSQLCGSLNNNEAIVKNDEWSRNKDIGTVNMELFGPVIIIIVKKLSKNCQ